MIYQKDWLMRQIETMTGAIFRFVFNGSSPASEMSDIINGETFIAAGLHENLFSMLRQGRFCEAEDLLFDEMDESDTAWFYVAVGFYAELNKFPDEVLNLHQFPREEIQSGLGDVCRRFGYDPILFGG